MDIKNLRIIADERERKSRIPALLTKLGVQTDFSTLVTGDYIVATDTGVERKSTRDLIASVVDGRLDEQCKRLKTEFRHPVLAVEGPSEEITRHVENSYVFYDTVARVAIESGISLVQTPDANGTARLLIALGTRKGVRRGELLKRQRRRPGASVREQQLCTLCSLPGIGEKLATRMLDRFGTPMAAFGASAPELARVEGLGAVRAKRLCAIMGSPARTRAPGRPASRRTPARRAAADRTAGLGAHVTRARRTAPRPAPRRTRAVRHD